MCAFFALNGVSFSDEQRQTGDGETANEESDEMNDALEKSQQHKSSSEGNASSEELSISTDDIKTAAIGQSTEESKDGGRIDQKHNSDLMADGGSEVDSELTTQKESDYGDSGHVNNDKNINDSKESQAATTGKQALTADLDEDLIEKKNAEEKEDYLSDKNTWEKGKEGLAGNRKEANDENEERNDIQETVHESELNSEDRRSIEGVHAGGDEGENTVVLTRGSEKESEEGSDGLLKSKTDSRDELNGEEDKENRDGGFDSGKQGDDTLEKGVETKDEERSLKDDEGNEQETTNGETVVDNEKQISVSSEFGFR